MDRRNFVIGSAVTAAALATGPTIAQDAYPSRPVTFVNPFPPGGAADVVGRPFAAAMEPLLKQPVVIETKAGAAGAVGAQFVASAKPDGYTLLVHIVSISGLCRGRQAVRPPAQIHPRRLHPDRAPDRRSDGARGQRQAALQDAEGACRRRQEAARTSIIFSSSGLYGALHLPTALFMKAAGIQMRHLPTAGGGPALTAILGNNSQVLVSSIAAAKRTDEGRKAACARLLLAKRAASLPDVPTLKELGYDVEFSLWVGLFAPKGTPDADHRPACATTPRRRSPTSSSRRRSRTSATWSPISTSRNSRNSGTRTPSASRRRCSRSARSGAEGGRNGSTTIRHRQRRLGRCHMVR